MELKKKLKIELSYDIAIPLLGIYTKKIKTLIWKDTCTPMLIAALFCQDRSNMCPSIDKEDMVYVCVYIFYTHIDHIYYIYRHTHTYTHTYTHTRKALGCWKCFRVYYSRVIWESSMDTSL